MTVEYEAWLATDEGARIHADLIALLDELPKEPVTLTNARQREATS